MDLTASGAQGESVLHYNVVNDQADVARLLLEQDKLEPLLGTDGTMLFHLAVKLNCLASIQVLLDVGIDANCQLDEQSLSVHYFSIPTMHMFLEKDFRAATLASRWLEDASPLYTASKLGYAAMVSILLASGADVHASGPSGTSIGAALAHFHADVVFVLLRNDANPFPQYCWNGHDAY